jgi:hypothetical protein
MFTDWQKSYQIWSGRTLIGGTKVEKLAPKLLVKKLTKYTSMTLSSV